MQDERSRHSQQASYPPSISIHAALDDYPQSRVIPYVHTYADRATLIGNPCVLLEDDAQSDLSLYLMWLAGEGVGPRQVYWVAPNGVPGSLYRAILADPIGLNRIREHVGAGGKLDLFATSDASEMFLREARFKRVDTFLPHPRVVMAADDKLLLRSMARTWRLERCFPEHELCMSEEELSSAFSSLMGRNNSRVVIKDPRCVSTDGMVFATTASDLEKFIARFWNPQHGAIVEALHEHLPVSAVWNLTDECPEFLYVSLQFLDGVGYGELVTLDHLRQPMPCAHRGNAIVEGACLGPVGDNEQQVIMMQTKQLAQALWAGTEDIPPYRGRICFDCLLLQDSRVFVTEANARTSASMYAWGVLEQVRRRFPRGVAVLMSNQHTVLRSFKELRARMGCRLYKNGVGGVIPYHVRAMRGGKCGLIAVDSSYDGAVQILREAEKLL